MSGSNDPLKMTFTPNTIEHLGVRMYSTLPPVLAELIANSYDADATKVELTLTDDSVKSIVVQDNGHGMTYGEINSNFLRIGRNRRANSDDTTPNGRKVIGKKGLGKLSFFGIAKLIEVSTTKNGKRNTFRLDWASIMSGDGDANQEASYEPEVLERDIETSDPAGTKITLLEIERESDFEVDTIADSLAKSFILAGDFKVFIRRNNESFVEIEGDRRFNSLDIQVEWDVPGQVGGPIDYLKSKGIKGKIFTTKKPISPKTNMRGVALFSRNKLVNAPEYFSDSASSNFYSYVTGWLEVDFVDEISPDLIGTSRQSLDWKRKETIELRENLQKLIRWIANDWREKRRAAQDEKISESTGIDVAAWKSTLPDDVSSLLSPLIDSLKKSSEEIPENDHELAAEVQKLKKLVPEYALLQWRYLNNDLQPAVESYYKSGDYYGAVFEGVKKYLDLVKAKSESTLEEKYMLENVFQLVNPVMSVTEGYTKSDGTDFRNDTHKNIKEGHRMIVLAVWQAFRDPIAHERHEELSASGMFTEKDCLDALSVLSHLYDRLDRATKIR